MEKLDFNYYELLDVKFDASREEIKQSYHKLLLLYHPDKSGNVTDLAKCSTEKMDRFCEIEKAWKVLQDDKSRKCYDAELKAREVQNIGPLHESEMTINQMVLNSKTQCYEHVCRCGGNYILEEEEAFEFKNSSITLYCDSCSLSITVNM